MFSPISSSSRSNSASDLSEGQAAATPANATLVHTVPSITRNARAFRQPEFLKTHRENLQNSLIDPRSEPFLPKVIIGEILSHLNVKDRLSFAASHFGALSIFCSPNAPHNRLGTKLNKFLANEALQNKLLANLKHYFAEYNRQFTPARWDALNPAELTKLLSRDAESRTLNDVIAAGLAPQSILGLDLPESHIGMLLRDDTLENLIALHLFESQPNWASFAKIPAECFEATPQGWAINLNYVTEHCLVPVIDAQNQNKISDKQDLFDTLQKSQLFLMGQDKNDKTAMCWAAEHSVKAAHLALNTSAGLQKNLMQRIYYTDRNNQKQEAFRSPLTRAFVGGNTHTIETLFAAGCTLKHLAYPENLSNPLARNVIGNLLVNLLNQTFASYENHQIASGKFKSFVSQIRHEGLWPETLKNINADLQSGFEQQVRNHSIAIPRIRKPYLDIAAFFLKEGGYKFFESYGIENFQPDTKAASQLFEIAMETEHLALAQQMLSPGNHDFIKRSLCFEYGGTGLEIYKNNIPDDSADYDYPERMISELIYAPKFSDIENRSAEGKQIDHAFLNAIFSLPHKAEIAKLLAGEKSKDIMHIVVNINDHALTESWVKHLDDSGTPHQLKKDALKLAKEYDKKEVAEALKAANVSISRLSNFKATTKSMFH